MPKWRTVSWSVTPYFHWWEATPVWILPEEVHKTETSTATHPYWGKATPVWLLSEKVHPAHSFTATHPNPHRRETTPVRLLSEEVPHRLYYIAALPHLHVNNYNRNSVWLLPAFIPKVLANPCMLCIHLALYIYGCSHYYVYICQNYKKYNPVEKA